MVEARAREAWDHTALIVSWLAEPHRDPKKRARPFAPADFHPYAAPRRREAPVAVVKMGEIRDLLMGLRPKRGR